MDNHASPSSSHTHLSHIHRWSCVPVCCCWCTRNGPCGRLEPPAPWHKPLRPPPPPLPVCEPSPIATSTWMEHWMLWHFRGNAAQASPSWELLCEARWGRWPACTILEQREKKCGWCIHAVFWRLCWVQFWFKKKKEAQKDKKTAATTNTNVDGLPFLQRIARKRSKLVKRAKTGKTEHYKTEKRREEKRRGTEPLKTECYLTTMTQLNNQ